MAKKKSGKKAKAKKGSKKTTSSSSKSTPRPEEEVTTSAAPNTNSLSSDFEAGLLFERFGGRAGSSSYGAEMLGTFGRGDGLPATLEPEQFQQLFKQMKTLAAQTARLPPDGFQNQGVRAASSRGKIGMTESDSFEAGRLFARYDRDGAGRLSKEEFASMFRDLKTRNVSFGGGEYNVSPMLGLSQLPSVGMDRVDESISPKKMSQGPKSPFIGAFNRGVGLHATTSNPYGIPLRLDPGGINERSLNRGSIGAGGTAGGPGVSSLSGKSDASLLSAGLGGLGAGSASSYEQMFLRSISGKKSAVLQQVQAVQSRMAEVQGMRRAVEQETLQEYEPILRRLRSAEAQKLSTLQQSLDELLGDINTLERMQQRVLSNRSYQDLLRIYPALVEIVQKPLASGIVDVSPELNREAAIREQKVQRYDTAMRLLRTKDQMLWLLVRERNSLRKAVGLPESDFNAGTDREGTVGGADQRGAEEMVARSEIEALSRDFCAEIEFMTSEVERLDKEMGQRDAILRTASRLSGEGKWAELSELLSPYRGEGIADSEEGASQKFESSELDPEPDGEQKQNSLRSQSFDYAGFATASLRQ
jgi:hypothetical protein